MVWAELARRYKIVDSSGKLAGNGGQIVKEFLEKEKQNGFKFTYMGENEYKNRIRKKRKRIAGTQITTPCEPSSKKVCLELNKEIENGTIDIGQRINAKSYKKLVIKNEKLEELEFTVEGRKHPLKKIRDNWVTKHKDFMRLPSCSKYTNDEVCDVLKMLGEYDSTLTQEEMRSKLIQLASNRSIQVWHDASTIANHSHLLFTCNVLYDQAVFLSDEEYQHKSGGPKIDIQSIVEEPELYIIGRCRSNDEQIGFIETREDCLKDLAQPIKCDEYDLMDTMRMFHGDGPALQMEAGNQKGGHYFCPSCEVLLASSHSIGYTYNLSHQSYLQKQQMIMRGRYAKINTNTGKLKPFQGLNAKQLKEELESRGVNTAGVKTTLKDLQPILKEELKGCQRVPILLKNNPKKGIKMLNLERYELALVEPMHDIGGHIDNVFEELPHHLTPEEKSLFEKVIEISYGNKETKRNVDKRKALLEVILQLDYKISGKPMNILKTLAEIQRILYLNESKRMPNEVLRLHNMCFLHFVLLKEVVGIDLKKVSRERMYGKYSHNLLVHSPIQYREINGRSINVENQERFFGSIKSITNQTSSKRPGNIIGNLIIRHDVEKRVKVNYSSDRKNEIENKISDLNKLVMKTQRNTFIPYELLKKYCLDWQAHLQRIADFLIEEEAWWKKTEFGVEFFDTEHPETFPLKPRVSHFRSTSIELIEKSLRDSWKEILEKGKIIPTHILFLQNQHQSTSAIMNTEFLSPYCHSDTAEDVNTQEQNTVVETLPSSLPEEESHYEAEEISPIEEEMDELLEKSNSSSSNSLIEEEMDELLEKNISSSSNSQAMQKVTTKKNTNIQNDMTSDLQNHSEQLHSKEGKLIFCVLGEYTKELKEYDTLKCKLKISMKAELRVKAQDLLVRIQTKVAKTVTELSEIIKKWERDFIIQNDHSVPTAEDFAKDLWITSQLQRLRTGKTLLKKYWKIDLYNDL